MHSILLVEKSKSQLSVLEQVLDRSGHSVSAYSSIDSALVHTRSASRPSYEQVIIGWPQRASKLDVTKMVNLALGESLYHLPLTILAGNERDSPEITDLKNRRSGITVLKSQDFSGLMKSLQGDEPIIESIPVDTMTDNALPVDKENDKRNAKSLVQKKNIRILLVDDSATARKKYADVLSAEGYDVIKAKSAEEGWAVAHKQLVDLAVIDFYLPSETGDVLCRRFREDPLFESLPCAILSGTYSDETIMQSLNSGAVEVMFKSEPDKLFMTRIHSLTRQIKQKKAATMERHRYEAILSSIGDGVYGVNKRGKITFINPAGRKILGYKTATDFMGNNAGLVFHHSDENGDPVSRGKDKLTETYLTGAVLNKHEAVFWRENKTSLFVECTVYPLPARFGAEGSVVAFRDVSERKRLESQLFWQATHDSLTSLFNRYRFEKALKFEFSRLKRLDIKKQSSLLFIDLDQFKYLNDTAGHDAGDHLLVDVAKKLKQVVRKSDVLARLGGDEFAVLIKDVNSDTAFKIAENIRHALEEVTYINEDISFKLSCTIGIAMMDHTMTPKKAMVNADIGCNIAKNRGRNQSWLFNEEKDIDKDGLNADMGWSTRLNDALANDGFVLFYQPILPLSGIDFEFLPDSASKLWTALSHLPEHYECLLRLVGENGEYISPFAFLNVAERFNLMQAIDIWVVGKALAKLEELQVDGRDINFSINLSGSTLNDNDTLEEITALMRNSNVRKGSVLFEITETSAIEKKDDARNFIQAMRKDGWRFALDDFGTGFSSFSQLKELPVDVVKIDGQFVRDMAKDEIDRAIVMAINDIAHSQGMETIAEYVEDASILRLLNICGVDHAQGYYIAKPLIDVRQRADDTQMLRLVEPLSGA